MLLGPCQRTQRRFGLTGENEKGTAQYIITGKAHEISNVSLEMALGPPTSSICNRRKFYHEF